MPFGRSGATSQVAEFKGTDRTEIAQRARFELLWQQHRPRVWRLVARLAGDADLADDLTQEVSLRAFQGFGGFRGDAGMFTWLYRIAVNVVQRHRERRHQDAIALDTPELMALPADDASDPETLALQADTRRAVREALDRLPDELRTTLILQLYEGLKYREVAVILNVPLGTVKSRLHNAMQRLKEELESDAV